MSRLLTDSALEAAGAWFEDNFRGRGELGAAVSVWQDGHEVLSLAQGHRSRERSTPWQKDTLVPVWSATKGVAALTCLLALEEADLPLETAVAEVWPEFVGGGKAGITFGHVLSHTAGLAVLDERVPIYDYEAVIRALEQQVPQWEPGRQQAYHARTFGFLLDEVVSRVTGASSLGAYYREVLRDPLELDFWIGLPPEECNRVATLYPGKMRFLERDQAFLKAFGTPGTTTQQAFQSPVGMNAIADFNQPDTWARGYPAMGGVGSASALARLYGMLATGEARFSPMVLRQLEETMSSGSDQVLHLPTAFSAGMMKDPVAEASGQKRRQMFGPSLRAFGHPGAGGSLAFADPERGLGFAYVMNQMEVGVLPTEKALGIVEALFS